jgi:hypothetical protein
LSHIDDVHWKVTIALFLLLFLLLHDRREVFSLAQFRNAFLVLFLDGISGADFLLKSLERERER